MQDELFNANAVGMVGMRIKNIVAFSSCVGGMVADQKEVGIPCKNYVFNPFPPPDQSNYFRPKRRNSIMLY